MAVWIARIVPGDNPGDLPKFVPQLQPAGADGLLAEVGTS